MFDHPLQHVHSSAFFATFFRHSQYSVPPERTAHLISYIIHRAPLPEASMLFCEKTPPNQESYSAFLPPSPRWRRAFMPSLSLHSPNTYGLNGPPFHPACPLRHEAYPEAIHLPVSDDPSCHAGTLRHCRTKSSNSTFDFSKFIRFCRLCPYSRICKPPQIARNSRAIVTGPASGPEKAMLRSCPQQADRVERWAYGLPPPEGASVSCNPRYWARSLTATCSQRTCSPPDATTEWWTFPMAFLC